MRGLTELIRWLEINPRGLLAPMLPSNLEHHELWTDDRRDIKINIRTHPLKSNQIEVEITAINGLPEHTHLIASKYLFPMW